MAQSLVSRCTGCAGGVAEMESTNNDLGCFLTVKPSLEELFDQIVQNYCGFRRKSGGPYRSMDIDASLEFEDVRFGCGVPLRIPFYVICRECGGSCISWGLCSACGGAGAVELANQVMLRFHRARETANAMN